LAPSKLLATETKTFNFKSKQMTTFNHGNRLRPEKEAYEVKKARSIRVYAEKNLLIDPYWLNEKILRKYYNLYGHGKHISPQILEDEGFDFNLTKSKMTINSNIFEMMHKYGYTLLQNQQIILCKI
jgi:hypothetical protein